MYRFWHLGKGEGDKQTGFQQSNRVLTHVILHQNINGHNFHIL